MDTSPAPTSGSSPGSAQRMQTFATPIPETLRPFDLMPDDNPQRTAELKAADAVAGENPNRSLTHLDFLDTRLLLIGSCIVLLVSGLMIASLIVRWIEYDKAIQVTLKQTPPLDHSAVLSYARSLDASIVKTTSLMLSFLVVFIGAIYVLRSSTVGFQLSIQNGGLKSSLETASPGLVMITLGLAVVVTTLLVRSSVDYRPPDYVVTYPVSSQTSPTEAGAPTPPSEGIKIQKGLGLEPLSPEKK